MASIKMSIEINLPDNWAEIVAEKLKESGDYVPVVRCKDCKYWERGKDYEPYCNHWKSGMADTVDDDFCSYGERKKDA